MKSFSLFAEIRIRCLSKVIAAGFCLMAACGVFANSAMAIEEVTLELTKLKFDPLLHFYPPPANSCDKYQFTKDGLEVRQFADTQGKVPWSAGFKSQLMTSGDFRVQLDLDVQCEEPLRGWGQGVAFMVVFNDVARTKLQFLRGALPGQGQTLQVELSGPKVTSPIYRPHPNEMVSGSLVIERVGSEAIFSIIENDETIEIDRLACPTADIGFVEVICTRQNRGNTNAFYLLKKLHVTADSFFAFDTGRKSWFTWWRFAVVAQIFVLGGLIYWGWKRSD